MKKIALLCLVAFYAVSLQAQQTINFEIVYKPNMTYKLLTEQTASTSVSYSEDMDPMVQENTSKIENIIKTGKATGNTMPVTMTLTPDKDSDAAVIMPQGAIIYGIVKDGMPQLDSLNAPGMIAETKSVMLTTFKTLASQNIVPKRTVKVGESFTIDTPLEMPMGPAILHMNTKTTYKLIRVEGKKAYFDLNMTVDLSTNIQGQDSKGSGAGTGTLVYDIDNNFFTERNFSSKSNMVIDAQGNKVSLAIGEVSNSSVVISKN